MRRVRGELLETVNEGDAREVIASYPGDVMLELGAWLRALEVGRIAPTEFPSWRDVEAFATFARNRIVLAYPSDEAREAVRRQVAPSNWRYQSGADYPVAGGGWAYLADPTSRLVSFREAMGWYLRGSDGC